jgi:hypothetical protein
MSSVLAENVWLRQEVVRLRDECRRQRIWLSVAADKIGSVIQFHSGEFWRDAVAHVQRLCERAAKGYDLRGGETAPEAEARRDRDFDSELRERGLLPPPEST